VQISYKALLYKMRQFDVSLPRASAHQSSATRESATELMNHYRRNMKRSRITILRIAALFFGNDIRVDGCYQ